MKKVLLIDGNSLVFRAFYATFYGGGLMLSSKEGIPTNALYSFANMITKLLKNNYDYSLIAFDTNKPTFRHLKYGDYKAGRNETPNELLIQFPLVKEMLSLMGLFPYSLEGYEADDIIGTMARLSKEKGYQVDIFSGDRDLLQLIDDNINVNLTKKGVSELKVMTKEALKEELGISPLQIIDLKSLMGDKSDNIPGIKGIGEKTALKLLNDYGTLENVLNATDIKGKLKEKIETYRNDAIMSKDLATIYTNVPLTFNFDDCCIKKIDLNNLNNFYKKYDMNSLISYETSKVTDDFKYKTVDDIEILNNKIGLFLDVNKDNYHMDNILGLGVSDGINNYVITFDKLINASKFLKVLNDDHVEKVCFDKKKLLVVFENHQIKINNVTDDIMLMTYLIDSSVKDDMNLIFNYYNEYVYKDLDDLSYLAKVSCFTLKHLEEAQKKLEELELIDLYKNIELPLVNVLKDMEITGFKVDKNILEELKVKYETKLNKISEEIKALAGEDFNINSPSQVATILFDKLGIKGNKKRSTGIQELEKLVDVHPIVGKIIEHRKYAKIISNYVIGLQNYILNDGKIHTIFNQTLTQTGRLSSKDPNLQNISVRDLEGKEIRHAFIASNKNNYILSFDYSQIELRVLAYMANSKTLIDAFNHDIDIHSLTAAKVLNKNINEVNELERRQAKVVNFGIVYGMSAWGLSEELKISPTEAKNFIDRYFESYPEILDYSNKTIEECKINGFVRTYFNRLRYVKEINDKNFNIREFGKRVALNTPIQGTAADIIKLAMIKVDQMLKEKHFETKMILQIHDELVFDVPYYELMQVMPLIEEIMENVVDFNMKLKVEGSYGYDYY